MGRSILPCLLAPIASAFAPPAGDVATLSTAHYDLRVEGLDAAETGRLLEALHGELTRFFGRAPERRLAVSLSATREAFEAALAADGEPKVAAGGYYAPSNGKAYSFVQPSEWFTRQLLLHECSHQFHFLAATANTGPQLGLYVEGLAEYLAMADWDGSTLALGALPRISLEDYPRAALEHFTGPLERDLAGMLRGARAVDRPEAWALVSFLAREHAELFRAWRERLDRHQDPAQVADEVLAPVLREGAEAFERWLRAHQQPWKVGSIAWQPWGDAIEGSSPDGTVAVATVNEHASSLEVELEPLVTPALSGLVFDYRARDDYRLLQLLPERRVRALRLKDGAWHAEGSWPAPPRVKDARDVMRVELRDGKASLSMNGVRLATLESVAAEGALGVHSQLGRTRFRRVVR